MEILIVKLNTNLIVPNVLQHTIFIQFRTVNYWKKKYQITFTVLILYNTVTQKSFEDRIYLNITYSHKMQLIMPKK